MTLPDFYQFPDLSFPDFSKFSQLTITLSSFTSKMKTLGSSNKNACKWKMVHCHSVNRNIHRICPWGSACLVTMFLRHTMWVGGSP